MSDDRLFVSNNPIGRLWYFINIIILAVIIFGTKFVFEQYVIPNTRTDEYTLIAQIIMYFLYLIYFITFLALIDRRLYDITGDRSSVIYQIVYGIMLIISFSQVFIYATDYFHIKLPLDISLLNFIGLIGSVIFIFITVILLFFKGKISGRTYNEYKKKPKYY